jgi:hypothetical protein
MNVTHEFVVQPNVTGRVMDVPARVAYEPVEGGDVQVRFADCDCD